MFRTIPGYRNDYSVSKTGKVQGPRKVLKQGTTEKGYKVLEVINDQGDAKKVKVARLLALAWIPNPNPNECIYVDHINGIRDDNRVENLRWIDPTCNSLNNRGVGCYKTGTKEHPWRAKICVGGEVINLGCFDTEAEGSAAARELRNCILDIRLRALYYQDNSRSPSFC